MKSFRSLITVYVFASLVFLVYSYGFVDKNLNLSTSSLYNNVHTPLQYLIYEKRGWAGGIYIAILSVLWILYYLLLKTINQKNVSFLQLKKIILVVSAIFLFSFPAFSYDIFNYMLTAKVAFVYKENPWVVRPIEIPNEPALAYTRAANKWALYGPTWILLTAIPQVLGMGNVWLTVIMFKLLILVFYYVFLWMIWKITANVWNIAFFALNPLVLITILNEAHNDIVMMVLAVSSLYLFCNRGLKVKRKLLSVAIWISSIFVKGATIILFPLFFIIKLKIHTIWMGGYWLMFFVFLISPLREEMYPWYFIWCICFVVLLPEKYQRLYGFTVALSFGLLLRNTAYIVTRQYDGYNQIFRTAITWIPPLCFLSFIVWKKLLVQKKI